MKCPWCRTGQWLGEGELVSGYEEEGIIWGDLEKEEEGEENE